MNTATFPLKPDPSDGEIVTGVNDVIASSRRSSSVSAHNRERRSRALTARPGRFLPETRTGCFDTPIAQARCDAGTERKIMDETLPLLGRHSIVVPPQ